MQELRGKGAQVERASWGDVLSQYHFFCFSPEETEWDVVFTSGISTAISREQHSLSSQPVGRLVRPSFWPSLPHSHPLPVPPRPSCWTWVGPTSYSAYPDTPLS